MRFSEGFILRLKSLCDIFSIFSTYVELKASGTNMRCCCPFHAEKTPSCFVYGSTQSFYCFGCGVGGDIITFIEKIENLSYVEAIKFLAKQVGLSLPDEEIEDNYSKKKATILKINREAAMFFYKNLKLRSGMRGVAYFKSRGLTAQTITRFGLGYALNDWFSLKNFLTKKGCSYEQMVEAGLVLKSKKGSYYDKFRDRVMFPIINLKGEVIGFGGRVLQEGTPKYLNTADSIVFKKGTELYGLNLAKKSRGKSLILAEGYLDVIALHQNGFSNAVATLGTALTKQQVLLISRNFETVVIAYDSDLAGRTAALRACELFEKVNLNTKILKFDGAKDPDEYLQKKGAARLKNLIDKACSFEDLVFDDAKAKVDLKDIEEKRKFIHKICSIIAKMGDSIKRDIYINKLSSELDLTKSVVKSHVNYLIKKNKAKNNNKIKLEMFRSLNNRQRCGYRQEAYNLRLVKAQEGVIRILFRNPSYFSRISDRVDVNYFDVDSLYRKIFEYLVKNFENENNLDFSDLRKILNDEEISEFSRIVNENDNFKNDEQELIDYIKILEQEFMKKNEDILKMSLEDLELKRQKKAKLKY